MSANPQPLVSVIIPMYNAELYVEEAINSILNQTYKNLEVIVVDDCSTDNSYEIVEKINDKRILLLKNETNSKISFTLNKAISHASGDFIARMDADDISLPTRIEKQVFFLKNNPHIDFCSTYLEYFGKQKGVLQNPTNIEKIRDIILTGSPFVHAATMFNIKKLNNNLYYKEEFATAEDIELFSRLLKKGYVGMNIPEILYFYRITGNQTIFNLDTKNNIVRSKQQSKLSNQIILENLRYAYSNGFKNEKLKECESLFLQEKVIKTIKQLNIFADFISNLDKQRDSNFYSKNAFLEIFYYKTLGFITLNKAKNSLLILTKPSILKLLLKKFL